MAVASVPLVSIVYLAILANAHPVSKETDVWVANRPKFAQVVNRISTVPTTPNVVQIELAVVDKALSPMEPCVWTLTNVKDNLTSVASLLAVQTHRVVMNVVASLH